MRHPPRAVPSRKTGLHAGFTLVELVVALTVAVLALTVVPVSMMKLHEGMQYRSTVRDLLSGLKAARSEALRSGAPVHFTLDTDEHWFTIDAQRKITLPESLRLGMIVAEREVRDQRGSIRFYPDGSSTGGSIIVRRNSGDGVRLRVDWLLGRVSQEPLT
jgi:general secretion pathway protein H